MTSGTKPSKTTEELETEIIGLNIRLRRVESFIQNMPVADDFLKSSVLGKGDVGDTLYEEAREVVQQYERASTSLLQRRLSIGYARASRLLDILTEKGIVAKSDGTSKPREVLAKPKK